MTIENASFPRSKRPKDITDVKRQAIKDLLLDQMNNWCENKGKEWFALRDLTVRDWKQPPLTPLMALYNNRIKGRTDEEAQKRAGQDGGYILRNLVDADEREFNTEIRTTKFGKKARHYSLLGK